MGCVLGSSMDSSPPCNLVFSCKLRSIHSWMFIWIIHVHNNPISGILKRAVLNCTFTAPAERETSLEQAGLRVARPYLALLSPAPELQAGKVVSYSHPILAPLTVLFSNRDTKMLLTEIQRKPETKRTPSTLILPVKTRTIKILVYFLQFYSLSRL